MCAVSQIVVGLGVALICCIPVPLAAQTQYAGCMGAASFSQWASANTFPYRPSSKRAKAIRRGRKRLNLGMTLEQVRNLMPEPDWSTESIQGCVWKYATEMASETPFDHGRDDAVSVGFRDNIVREIGSGRPWEFVDH
jgi:hypothetical protein